jgi:hypothetical protein
MKPINLTKKVVGSGRLRLSEGGEFVTNGHWLCRRSMLKQGPELTSVEAAKALYPRAYDVQLVPDASVERVVPNFGNPVVFERTRWIQFADKGDETVLFVAKDGSQIWIDRRYVELFNLEEITSQSCPGEVSIDPAIVGTNKSDWTVCVMPKRLDFMKEIGHRAVL